MYRGFGTPIAASIIRQAQQGRRDAQQHIFETFQTAVLTSLLGLCRERELARDLAQDVFIQVFAKIHQLRDVTAFGGWLKQLTVNCALAHFRKQSWLVLEANDQHQPVDEQPYQQADWLSHCDDIEQLMQCLTKAEQQLVWLYLVEDYSHQQLATLYEVPAATIRQRYHRALKKLQQAANHGAEHG
ncbi:RNA polymerase sigma factor [Pseudidiomarina mangrovi]|uniref:RNA polymerase sigma factor n=1 Tax=Pseudidiomarina mangrovi TaxID=2487133 RepID=UPI000FCCD0AD|nr:sigma-70 family RNA polymerase sigma factor [Pseudidiomarina mangrovi]